MSQTPNYAEQGGARWAIGPGGAFDVESGGELRIAGTDRTAALLAAATGVVSNPVAAPASGKKIHGAAYTVVADDDTAGTVTLATGVTIAAKVVQILRAGVDVTGDAVISSSAANLVVGDGATYDLTTGDVVNYLVFGT